MKGADAQKEFTPLDSKNTEEILELSGLLSVELLRDTIHIIPERVRK